MADRISVQYDANVDDLKRKLDDLIAKNTQLANAANTAQRAMAGLNSTVGSTNNALNQSTTVINNYNNSVNTTNNSVNNLNNSLKNTRGQLGLLDGFLQRIAARMAAVFAIDSIINFGKAVVDVTRKTELLQNRLNFVFENAESGRAAFDRLYETAQKLGIGFEDLLQGFSGFGIAARAAGFSAKTTETIFVKVATSLRAAGASSLQTQRAFYALQQMLSKGVVAAEELRRQLGEALPGASDKMTKAYNRLHPAQQLTNRQFTKLLEDGKILSAEILPEFANVLEEDFGPALAGKQNSLDATLIRAGNAFERFKLQIGETNFEQISGTFKWLEGRLNNINILLKNSKGFWESYSNVVNEFFLGDSNVGLGRTWLGRWWQERREEEKWVQGMNEKNFNDQAMNYAKGRGQKKELDKMTKEELLTRRKILQEEIEANKLTSTSTETQVSNQKARIRGLGLIIEKLQVIYERENENLQAANEAEIEKAEQRRKALKLLEEEMEKQKKLYEDSLKDGKSTREQQLKLQKDYVDAYVNYEVKQQEAGVNQAAAIRLKKQEEVNLEILNMDLDALQTQLINYKKLGLDTIAIDRQIKDKRIEIIKLTGKTKEEIDLKIAQLEDKEREETSKKDIAAVEKELNAFKEAQQEKISKTKEGSKERLDLENELLNKEEELMKKMVDLSIGLTEEKESKKSEITATYTKKRRALNEKTDNQEENHAERILKILQESQDLIERSEGDSFSRRLARSNQTFEKMRRKIEEEIKRIGAILAKTPEESAFLKGLEEQLQRVTNAGKEAASAITVEQFGEVVGRFGDLYDEVLRKQSILYENEQNNLKRMLDQKLISEEEYEAKSLVLKKKQFEQEKQAAIVGAIIDGAAAIVRALKNPLEVAFVAAMVTAQIATIQSQKFPGFKEGVIDLQGAGTATSDSIPARLSRGESVMTAAETAKYKPVLQAIRDGEFEAFVAKRYTDAMRKQDGSGKSKESFAENIVNAFDLQSAEIINAIGKNKRVKIDNVKELAGAIFPNTIRHRATSKKLN